MWTQDLAIDLCTRIEAVAPNFGCHVGLTGGCLYKRGPRKDLDVVVYRIRQVREVQREALFEMLNQALGVGVVRDCGFVVKATWCGLDVDFLFPETPTGTYEREVV
jgi:hypothetical protein